MKRKNISAVEAFVKEHEDDVVDSEDNEKAFVMEDAHMNETFDYDLIDFDDFVGKKVELLILGRMGIIESPLFERDISTDKVNKPANLFMLVLN